MYDPARDSWDERRDDASRKSPEGRFSRLVCSIFFSIGTLFVPGPVLL